MKMPDGRHKVLEFSLPLPLSIVGPLLTALCECLEANGWTEVSVTSGVQTILAWAPGEQPAPAEAASPARVSLAMMTALRDMREHGPGVIPSGHLNTMRALERRGYVRLGDAGSPRRYVLTAAGRRVVDTAHPVEGTHQP